MTERTFWEWKTIRAADLRVGDVCRSRDGEGQVVLSIDTAEPRGRAAELHVLWVPDRPGGLACTPSTYRQYQLIDIQVPE